MQLDMQAWEYRNASLFHLHHDIFLQWESYCIDLENIFHHIIYIYLVNIFLILWLEFIQFPREYHIYLFTQSERNHLRETKRWIIFSLLEECYRHTCDADRLCEFLLCEIFSSTEFFDFGLHSFIHVRGYNSSLTSPPRHRELMASRTSSPQRYSVS